MKTTPSEISNLHRGRIQTVSKILKWFSALAVAAHLFHSVLIFFLPVVAVGPQYRNPARVTMEHQAPAVAPLEPGPQFERRRLIVDLHKAPPSFLFFNYMPGPSDILAEREWLARTAGSLHTFYYAIGGILFFVLFRSYERGRVFNLETVRGLRWIGLWLIGAWVMSVLFNLSSIFWRQIPHVAFSFPSAELLAGLFLYVIAWIMEEAHRLAEEQALTV